MELTCRFDRSPLSYRTEGAVTNAIFENCSFSHQRALDLDSNDTVSYAIPACHNHCQKRLLPLSIPWKIRTHGFFISTALYALTETTTTHPTTLCLDNHRRRFQKPRPYPQYRNHSPHRCRKSGLHLVKQALTFPSSG
jgi:hypothetical protein